MNGGPAPAIRGWRVCLPQRPRPVASPRLRSRNSRGHSARRPPWSRADTPSGSGRGFCFSALAPAEAFGLTARVSFDCRTYGVYDAAIDRQLCPLHRTDEAVLELLKRLVQGAKENHWSPTGTSPLGYISERAANGSIVGTKRKSNPLCDRSDEAVG
jgi:hypothetical protein